MHVDMTAQVSSSVGAFVDGGIIPPTMIDNTAASCWRSGGSGLRVPLIATPPINSVINYAATRRQSDAGKLATLSRNADLHTYRRAVR